MNSMNHTKQEQTPPAQAPSCLYTITSQTKKTVNKHQHCREKATLKSMKIVTNEDSNHIDASEGREIEESIVSLGSRNPVVV